MAPYPVDSRYPTFKQMYEQMYGARSLRCSLPRVYTSRLVKFLLHNINSIYFTLAVLKQPFCGKFRHFGRLSSLLLSTISFKSVWPLHWRALYLFCACDCSTTFFLTPSPWLSHEPLFFRWDHSVAGMKTVELPPLFPYQFSRLLLLPRTLSNILDFHGRYGTVFPSLSSTVDSRQLKPSGKSRSKVNGTTSASQKFKPA